MKKNRSKIFKRSPFVESVAIRARYFPEYVPAVIYGDTKINDIVRLLKEGRRFFTNTAVYYAVEE